MKVNPNHVYAFPGKKLWKCDKNKTTGKFVVYPVVVVKNEDWRPKFNLKYWSSSMVYYWCDFHKDTPIEFIGKYGYTDYNKNTKNSKNYIIFGHALDIPYDVSLSKRECKTLDMPYMVRLNNRKRFR